MTVLGPTLCAGASVLVASIYDWTNSQKMIISGALFLLVVSIIGGVRLAYQQVKRETENASKKIIDALADHKRVAQEQLTTWRERQNSDRRVKALQDDQVEAINTAIEQSYSKLCAVMENAPITLRCRVESTRIDEMFSVLESLCNRIDRAQDSIRHK